jgi:hypothetical protein
VEHVLRAIFWRETFLLPVDEEAVSAFLEEGAVSGGGSRFWRREPVSGGGSPFLEEGARFWRREPFLPFWREKGTVYRIQRKTLSPSSSSQ